MTFCLFFVFFAAKNSKVAKTLEMLIRLLCMSAFSPLNELPLPLSLVWEAKRTWRSLSRSPPSTWRTSTDQQGKPLPCRSRRRHIMGKPLLLDRLRKTMRKLRAAGTSKFLNLWKNSAATFIFSWLQLQSGNFYYTTLKVNACCSVDILAGHRFILLSYFLLS